MGTGLHFHGMKAIMVTQTLFSLWVLLLLTSEVNCQLPNSCGYPLIECNGDPLPTDLAMNMLDPNWTLPSPLGTPTDASGLGYPSNVEVIRNTATPSSVFTIPSQTSCTISDVHTIRLLVWLAGDVGSSTEIVKFGNFRVVQKPGLLLDVHADVSGNPVPSTPTDQIVSSQTWIPIQFTVDPNGLFFAMNFRIDIDGHTTQASNEQFGFEVSNLEMTGDVSVACFELALDTTWRDVNFTIADSSCASIVEQICAEEQNEAPTVNEPDALCCDSDGDLQNQNCTKVIFDGDGFDNVTDNYTCSIVNYQLTANGTLVEDGPPTIVDATFESETQVTCPVDSGMSANVTLISALYEELGYGVVIVLPTDCFQCTDEFDELETTDEACYINGQCLPDGVTVPGDSSLYCNAIQNPLAGTPVPQGFHERLKSCVDSGTTLPATFATVNFGIYAKFPFDLASFPIGEDVYESNALNITRSGQTHATVTLRFTDPITGEDQIVTGLVHICRRCWRLRFRRCYWRRIWWGSCYRWRCRCYWRHCRICTSTGFVRLRFTHSNGVSSLLSFHRPVQFDHDVSGQLYNVGGIPILNPASVSCIDINNVESCKWLPSRYCRHYVWCTKDCN